MEDVFVGGSQESLLSDEFDNLGNDFEKEHLIEMMKGRRAISSGEPSLDGSIDDERSVVSDSEIGNVSRTGTIAKQARGPSSDALEGDCAAEHRERARKAEEWEDVLGSGELMRRVERKGEGERPTDEWIVRVNVVDSNGVDSHEDLEFILGFSYVIDAWELVVKLMRVGEKCTVKSSPRFAYGEKGLNPTIPPNQSQEYTIELISASKMEFHTLSDEKLTEVLIQLKERGNFFFSRQEYEKAIFVYRRAVSMWTGVEGAEEGKRREGEGMRKILSAFHSNLAVCYAKEGEWKNCLEAAESSLQMDRQNGKALFRKGQSLSRLGEMEEAISILTEARANDPHDSAIEKELELAKRAGIASRQKEKQLYKKMLNGIRSEEEEKKEGDQNRMRLLIVIIPMSIILIGVFIHFFFS